MPNTFLWLLVRLMDQSRLDAVALTWAQRAQAELGAKARFMELKNQLIDGRASKRVIELSARAILEEDRHSEMCAEMARQFGHKSGFALFDGVQFNFQKPWEKLSSFRDRLLCEMVLMCCLTETINASLLNRIYGQASDSQATRTIKAILRDEVKHSQMGWAHLASEAKKRDVSFLSKHLDAMLDISVKDELFIPAPHLHDNQEYDYGVMPAGYRLDQFIGTLKTVVIPGFKEFNIDTSGIDSWLHKRQGDSGLDQPARVGSFF